MNNKILPMVVVTVDIAVIAVATYGGALSHRSHPAWWFSFGVAALAVVTFFGLLQMGAGLGSERQVQRAIAATAVVVYLVLVSITAFYVLRREHLEIHPLTSMLMTNFTVVVGLLVAFYFGSSALIEAKKP